MPEVVAILCSGQGGRHPAMFDLVVNRPEAKPVFAARSAAFGFSSSVASAIDRCTSGSYATSLVKAVLERQLLADCVEEVCELAIWDRTMQPAHRA